MSEVLQDQPLVKLYYRIGEVSEIVGVEPHVLRYWETEFRSIRPQKSRKGQRIYSRKDVERLLKVKDLLYTHGYTIAGARKRLRTVGDEPQPQEDPTRSALRGIRQSLLAIRAEAQALLQEVQGPRSPL
ncbi:MAG: MerR family transcriptional regulator [Polyangiaceae bacterium]|nr:MerR family transcriptional regulator [Polyangiaceae bacterium]